MSENIFVLSLINTVFYKLLKPNTLASASMALFSHWSQNLERFVDMYSVQKLSITFLQKTIKHM